MIRSVVLLVALAAGLGTVPGQATVEPQDVLLERLARVALLYRSAALSFTCSETITWYSRAYGRGSEGFKYVLAYEDESGFRDYRRRGRYRPRHPDSNVISPPSTGVPRWLNVPYLWALVFRAERQPYHRYEIVGRETVLDRPTIMIEFEPIEPYHVNVNYWFGTAWVDAETTQLVKVEAYTPDDHRRLLALREGDPEREATGAVPFIEKITTEFAVEKNGMRFPSRVDIREAPAWEVGKHGNFESARRLGIHVTQRYHDYQFFNVRTKDEIRAAVEGK